MSRISSILAWVAALLLAGPSAFLSDAAVVTNKPSVGRLADEYTTRHWGVEDGLPEGSVNGIAQSRDRYLWVVTLRSVVRFDGNRFVPMASLTSESMAVKGVFQTLCPTRDGSVWVTRTKGMWRLAGESLVQMMTFSNETDVVLELHEMPEGRLLGITAAGAISYYDGCFRTETNAEYLVMNSVNVRSAASSCFSVRWRSEAVMIRRGELWEEIPLPGRPWHNPNNAIVDHEGNIWVGFSSGVARYKKGKWAVMGNAEDSRPWHVRSLFEDAEGNIWVGTSSGLSLLRRRSVLMHDADPLCGRGLITALSSSTNGLLIAIKGGEVYEGLPGRFARCDNPLLNIESTISVIRRQKDGTLLAGTRGSDLYSSVGQKWIHIVSVQPGASARGITALTEDGSGRLWVGTWDGVMCRMDSRGLSYPVYGSTPSPYVIASVNCLCTASDGSIWVGYDGYGLGRFTTTSSQGTLFDKATGLPSLIIKSLYSDGDGVLWIGTSSGLARWAGAERGVITTGNVQALDDVRQILEDGDGNLWIGTRHGIVRANKKDLANVACGRTPHAFTRLFGYSEGLSSEEILSGNASARTEDGRLWFLTADGLAEIQPSCLATQTSVNLRVYIEEFLIDGKRASHAVLSRRAGMEDGGRVDIPPGTMEVSFRVAAIWMSAMERLQFRWRLEGRDIAWSEPGPEQVATYRNLPPGSYRFRVMAGVDESWQECEGGVAFRIHPLIWQTHWFAAGMLGCLFALVVSLVRLVDRRRARRKLEAVERATALELERARIARDMHDELGAGLTQIALMADIASDQQLAQEDAGRHFEKIAGRARDVVAALDEIVWAVNPRNDSLIRLADYLYRIADSVFDGTDIHCSKRVPMDLPEVGVSADVRHNLVLAVKEAMTNVLKHSGGSEMRLRLKWNAPDLSIVVEDNGRGIGGGGGAEGGREGNGLRNQRQRMEQIGGRVRMDAAAEGRGTRVTFEIRLS